MHRFCSFLIGPAGYPGVPGIKGSAFGKSKFILYLINVEIPLRECPNACSYEDASNRNFFSSSNSC